MREKGGAGFGLHLSETRKTELMLGDGNRSRNRETAKIFFVPVTQPLTVRRSTQMKQSNRAKWSGWRTLIGVMRSMWRHLRPPQLLGFNKEWWGVKC